MAIARTAPRTLNFSFIAERLVLQDGRGIRVSSERFGIAFREDRHHPCVKVIHGMIEDRAKTAVVFLASFINISSQPHTNIFVLTSQANVLGPQQLNILHRHFGDAIGAPVKLLLLARQVRNVEGDGIDGRGLASLQSV